MMRKATSQAIVAPLETNVRVTAIQVRLAAKKSHLIAPGRTESHPVALVFFPFLKRAQNRRFVQHLTSKPPALVT
jgi:hypothetical protein